MVFINVCQIKFVCIDITACEQVHVVETVLIKGPMRYLRNMRIYNGHQSEIGIFNPSDDRTR